MVAKGYRPVERDQEFLLPVNMREWLPASDPVWVFIETVAVLDTSRLHAKRKVGGVGRAGYDPDMMLTLLIWAWAQGQRSSRRIEKLCHRDIAFRVICGGNTPDHVTLARFLVDCTDVIEDLFVQVLALCGRVGMGKVGVVALDGVKIASNASMGANRTEDGLRAALEREARNAAAEHAAADAADDAAPGDDEVPPELIDPRSRRGRIAAALADLEAENQRTAAEDAQRAERMTERAEQRRAAEAERKQFLADLIARAEQGTRRGRVPQEVEVEVYGATLARARARQQHKIDNPGKRGPKAIPVEQEGTVIAARERWEQAVADRREREQQQQQAAAAAQTAPQTAAAGTGAGEAGGEAGTGVAPVGVKERGRVPNPNDPGRGQARRNITDPQSRLMPLRGGGWLQGYNCQAVTSSDGLIIATGVGNNPADVTTFVEMMGKAVAAARTLAEHRPSTGDEDSDDEIGLMLADAGYLSEENCTCEGPDRLIATGKHRAVRRAAKDTPAAGPPPADASPLDAMAHRLATEEGATAYAQRSHIAETPFGHAKHNMGFRRFTGRGLPRATAEFALHGLVHNLTKAIGAGFLTTETVTAATA